MGYPSQNKNKAERRQGLADEFLHVKESIHTHTPERSHSIIATYLHNFRKSWKPFGRKSGKGINDQERDLLSVPHHHRPFSFYLTTPFPCFFQLPWSCPIALPACFLLFPNQSQYVQPMCYFRRPAESPTSQG